VALTVLSEESQPALVELAGALRAGGLRAGIYLGASGKIAKQMKWANDQRATFTVLLGPREYADGVVTVRDMTSGDQVQVPLAEAAEYLLEKTRS
jgi:histidyl-tRNA synthetase